MAPLHDLLYLLHLSDLEKVYYDYIMNNVMDISLNSFLRMNLFELRSLLWAVHVPLSTDIEDLPHHLMDEVSLIALHLPALNITRPDGMKQTLPLEKTKMWKKKNVKNETNQKLFV